MDCLGYPWSDGDLCSLLCDQALWLEAVELFVNNTSPPLAQLVDQRTHQGVVHRQRLLRKCLRTNRYATARPTDNKSIAGLLMQDFRTPHVRQRLHRELDRRLHNKDFIASLVYRVVALRDRKTKVLPPIQEISTTTTQPFYMDVSKFDRWLGEHPTVPDTRWAICAFATAFAILQPNIADSLARTLQAHDPNVLPFLQVESRTISIPAESDQADADERTASAPSDEAVRNKLSDQDHPSLQQAQTRISPPVTIAIVAHFSKALADMKVGQLRQVLDEVSPTIAKLHSALHSIDHLRQKIHEHWSQLHTGGLVVSPSLYDTTVDDMLLDTAMQREEAVWSTIQEAEQLHQQWLVLNRQLHGKDPQWSHPASQSIEELNDVIQGEIRVLADELEKQRRDQNALDVLMDTLFTLDWTSSQLLLEDIGPETWASVCRLALRNKIPLDNMREVLPDHDEASLFGIALRVLWQQNSELALKVLEEVASAFAGRQGYVLCSYLAALTPMQLLAVTRRIPSLAEMIAARWFVSCLRSGNIDDFAWLEQIMHQANVGHTCSRLYALCIRGVGRGEWKDTRDAILACCGVLDLPEQNPGDIVAMTARPPGMSGIYKTLCDAAYAQFVRPIQRFVLNGERHAAWLLWQKYGKIEWMVDQAARAASGTQRPQNEHRARCRRYLQSVEAALIEWTSSARPGASGEVQQAVSIVGQLLKDVETEGEGPSKAVLDAIMLLRDENATIHTEGYGHTIGDEAMTPVSWLRPFLTRSWATAARAPSGECSIVLFLLDLLALTGSAVISEITPDLIRSYIEHDEWHAAAKAAAGMPELASMVQDAARERLSHILDRFPDLLERARQISMKDEDVAIYLLEIEDRANNYDFRECERLAPSLHDATAHWEDVGVREYDRLSMFLGSTEGRTLQQLRREVEATLTANARRRVHVEALSAWTKMVGVPDGLRREVEQLVERLDRLSAWPSETDAQEIAAWLNELAAFLEKKRRIRDQRPTQYDLLLESIISWSVQRLSSVLGVRGSLAAAALQDIGDFVLELVTENLETQEVVDRLKGLWRPSAGRDSGETVEVTPGPLVPARSMFGDRTDMLAHLATQMRASLRLLLLPEGSLTALHDKGNDDCRRLFETAIATGQWDDFRAVVCMRIREEDLDAVTLTDEELLFLASSLCSSVGQEYRVDKETALAACLAIVWLLQDADTGEQSVVRKALEEGLVAGVTIGLGRGPIDATGDCDNRRLLAAALEKTANGPSSSREFQWAMSLLKSLRLIGASSNNGPVGLANIVWTTLTSAQREAAKPRSALLLLLFKCQMDEELRVMVQQHLKPPLDTYVTRFLSAVRAARANPAAWEEARRMAQLFHMEPKKGPFKPWGMLIDAMNTVPADEAFRQPCQIVLENTSLASAEQAILDVVIRPLPYEFITDLKIIVETPGATGTQVFELATEDAMIAEPQSVELELRVPLELSDDILVIPYEAIGETTRGRVIREKGSWSVPCRHRHFVPVMPGDLTRWWPGATGDPLRPSMKAFHGRADAKDLISRAIAGADGKQGSVVVIGQRRIGKTSLLIEMLSEVPPSEGHVTGAYVNIGGIGPSLRGQTLSEQLFYELTELEDPGSLNRKLCETLRGSLGPKWSKELRAGLDPAANIATALTRFVERIADATGGKIGRLALFIDEFQAIFSFSRKEVDQLMWRLRPIVQMSRNLSLVFAGSGLTTQLVRSYDQALFGSVSRVELDPFHMPADADAIGATLLPLEARGRLCTTDWDALVAKAHDITGGHPWYLALLGYCAAKLLRGRPFTPSLLERVARDMVHGGVGSHDRGIEASWFYGHLFESLASLPRQRTVAELLLCNIAKQVTVQWPWLTVDDAINGPSLNEVAPASRERLAVFVLLRDMGVLIQQQSHRTSPRYRMVSPLLAEAIRYDAVELEYQARLNATE